MVRNSQSNFVWKVLTIAILGLPAIYSPSETQLLIDKGFVRLGRKLFTDVPSETTEQQYEERCQEQIIAYQEIYLEKRIENAKKYMKQILAGKRKKAAKSGSDCSMITEEAVLDEVRRTAISDASNVFIQIPTEEPFEVGRWFDS